MSHIGGAGGEHGHEAVCEAHEGGGVGEADQTGEVVVDEMEVKGGGRNGGREEKRGTVGRRRI